MIYFSIKFLVRLLLTNLKYCFLLLQYLELARHQRHYGYIMAGQGLAEWGSGGATKGYAQVLLGHSGLLLLTQDHHEAYFKVVRMRCWRITSKRMVTSILFIYT